MPAVAIRFRTQLHAHWRAWLSLALLAGVLAGIVVGGAAASVRTHGSYHRYLISIHEADVYVDPFVGFGDDSFPLNRVARLPQVAHSERALHLAVISRSRSGRPVEPDGKDPVEYLMPSDGHPVDTIDRLKVLRGRLPDPTRPDEVIGDTKALHTLGVDVGDTFPIRTITRHQLWAHGNDIRLTADPLMARWGPLVTLRVVGVAANARADIDGGQMHLTPAFYDTYGGRQVGAFVEELVIRLRHGQADLSAFKRATARIAGKRQYLIFQPGEGHPKIQHSIDLEARALWIVTALGALAALVIVAQALLRIAISEGRDDPTLRALGMTPGQRVAHAALRSLAIALPAAALTVLVAYLVSPLAPIGWARELDPRTGFAFDARVIGMGAAIVAVVILAAGTLGGMRALSRSCPKPTGPGRETAAVGLARSIASPPLACGLRMALVGRGRGPARATVAAATTAVVVAVTALTFGASFRHLLDTPALYGQTWDYETFPGPPPSPSTLHDLGANPGIVAIAGGMDDSVEVNGHETGARGVSDIQGHIAPTVISGRAPRGPNEILLATKTLGEAGAHIGGFVTVRGRAPQARRMRVVATGVLPSSKLNRLGYGAIMSFAALKRLSPTATPGALEVRVTHGPARRAAMRHLDGIFDGNLVIKPDEVGDFGRIDNLPLYIVVLFTAVAGAALASALASSVRRRRRDLAILKTLGFTRTQVAAAVAWQATTIVAIATLIGIPLGLGMGRLLWHLFATDLGVLPEPVAPLGLTVLVVPAAILFANAVAALPGAAAARVRPAVVLRTE